MAGGVSVSVNALHLKNVTQRVTCPTLLDTYLYHIYNCKVTMYIYIVYMTTYKFHTHYLPKF